MKHDDADAITDVHLQPKASVPA